MTHQPPPSPQPPSVPTWGQPQPTFQPTPHGPTRQGHAPQWSGPAPSHATSAPVHQPAHPPQPAAPLVVTTDQVANRTIAASLGEVIGVTVREREIDPKQDPQIAYPAMLLHSRRQAVARMVEMARERGADAVVGLRFDSSEITQDLSEVIAYGTAVRLG